jgi:hypothetical protein
MKFAALLFALAASALPKYWNVHIDDVADRATYEEMHKQEYALQRDILAAHDVPRVVGWKFSTSDGVYFNLRGRKSLADFETPSPVPAEVRKEINEKQAPLEPRIHGSLHEHHSEVWETDSDITALADMHAPKFIRYHRDVIKPSQFDAYGELQKSIRDALQKRGVSVLAMFGSYGDGAVHYLFLSDTPFDVKAIVGADVMKKWKDCCLSSHEVDAKARYDLTLTDAANWIQ